MPDLYTPDTETYLLTAALAAIFLFLHFIIPIPMATSEEMPKIIWAIVVFLFFLFFENSTVSCEFCFNFAL